MMTTLGQAVKQEPDALFVDADGVIWDPDEVLAQWGPDIHQEVVWIEDRIRVENPDGYAGAELLRQLTPEEAGIVRAESMLTIAEVQAWREGPAR